MPADGERGSASLEFMTAGVLLLVPLVYLVLTLAALQGAAFAAEGAARQAARVTALAPAPSLGRQQAEAAVATALADWRVQPGATRTDILCAPRPDDCGTPRGTVTVTIRIEVALPFLPPAVRRSTPGAVAVQASAVQRVSTFTVSTR